MATQAHAEITYGRRGLDLMEAGLSPVEAVERLVSDDDMSSHRQVGMVTADGSSASFTGEDCFEHAKGVSGPTFAAQGNILRSPDVPQAMATKFEQARGDLAHRLLAALAAGEKAGGEQRGMESAALLVVRPGGGYGGNNDRWLDLRVDHSDNPIEDLRGLLDLHTLYLGRSEDKNLLPLDEQLGIEVEGLLVSAGWWDDERPLPDNLEAWVGWHNLEERWTGPERLDPVVLRELRSAAARSGQGPA